MISSKVLSRSGQWLNTDAAAAVQRKNSLKRIRVSLRFCHPTRMRWWKTRQHARLRRSISQVVFNGSHIQQIIAIKFVADTAGLNGNRRTVDEHIRGKNCPLLPCIVD
jgi:hypothetical protein